MSSPSTRVQVRFLHASASSIGLASRGRADRSRQNFRHQTATRRAALHPEAFLFVTSRGVRYDERYTKIWRDACAKVKVPYVEPYHAFKHSLGYQMRLTGASRTDIQSWFGHRSAKSTDRYFRDDVRVLERVRGLVLQARTVPSKENADGRP